MAITRRQLSLWVGELFYHAVVVVCVDGHMMCSNPYLRKRTHDGEVYTVAQAMFYLATNIKITLWPSAGTTYLMSHCAHRYCMAPDHHQTVVLYA